jgi:hypothetical protein
MDGARRLGLTVQLRASRGPRSNSRYIHMPDGQVIRVSDHRAVEQRTALNLVVRRPEDYPPAVNDGLTWINRNYAA